MKLIILMLFSAILSVAGYVYGEGGKKGNPNELPEQCFYVLPDNAEEVCTVANSPIHSGVVYYQCDDVTIVCVDEQEDDD